MDNMFKRGLAAIHCFLLLSSMILVSGCGKTTASISAPVRTEIGHGDNYKIGVILPLSGKLKIYGESTLHGMECALGIFRPCNGPIRAELVIKDDRGDPELASAAVEDLVNNEHVSVIIGPLASAAVDAAAQKAQTLGVPLISLSQKEGVTRTGDFIFNVAMTADAQVKEIVNWAVNKKKIRNFAVVYPLSAYGQTYKQLFTEAVKDHGGRIVLSDGYGEANLDFGSIFQRSGQKFDALFIPDSYRAIGYLSSALMLQGMDGIQLLGNNRWNNKELIERGGEAVQGAVFVDGFFDQSKEYNVQQFVSLFEQAYRLKPTILEAQGFDAARLAAKALQLTGGKHAIDVRNALATLPDIEGSTGPTGFDQNRNIVKRVFLLTVKDDNIVEMEGASNLPVKKDKYGAPLPLNPETGTKKY